MTAADLDGKTNKNDRPATANCEPVQTFTTEAQRKGNIYFIHCRAHEQGQKPGKDKTT